MKRRTSCRTKVACQILGRKAVQNIGDGSEGQFALVTPCRNQVDFSLWANRKAAEKFKSRLDRIGCCGGCWPGSHYIMDLESTVSRKQS